MKWFKHDTDASADAKIKKLILRHGATGYAVYFHCIELIAGNVGESNITFELEHDSEIIADNLKIKGDENQAGVDKVNVIMSYIVELGLFESMDNRITCMKLAQRLDQSMTNNKNLRKVISEIKGTNHGFVYVLKSEHGYKIGKSLNYEGRIETFGVKLPFEIEPVRIYEVDNYSKIESAFHKDYDGIRLNGEWFKLSEDNLSEMDRKIESIGGTIVMTCHDMSCKNRIEEKRIDKKRKEEKRLEGGALVLITGSIHDKLVSKYGEKVVLEYYEKISDYSASSGKTYKDYALTAKNWISKDEAAGKLKPDANMYREIGWKNCPECGEKLIDHAVFCTACGHDF